MRHKHSRFRLLTWALILGACLSHAACTTAATRPANEPSDSTTALEQAVSPGEARMAGSEAEQRVPGDDATSSLEQQLQSLATQIAGSFRGDGTVRIAVLAFSNLDGSTSDLGLYVAEELVTRLFLTRRFDVIERGLLNKVLQEHELSLTGVIDENSAKELGRILGIEAIVSGSITDLQESVKINARMISAETGRLSSVAATTLPKDATISALMARRSPESDTLSERQPEDRTASAGIVYFEDFSNVAEGMVPETWIGADHLHVRTSDGPRGGKELVPFEGGPYSFTVPGVEFPENWVVELEVEVSRWWSPRQFPRHMKWTFGNIVVLLHGSELVLNKTRVVPGISTGQIHLVRISKNGPVVTLYADESKRAVARIAEAEPPQGISFAYVPYRGQGMMIRSIKVSHLSDLIAPPPRSTR